MLPPTPGRSTHGQEMLGEQGQRAPVEGDMAKGCPTGMGP